MRRDDAVGVGRGRRVGQRRALQEVQPSKPWSISVLSSFDAFPSGFDPDAVDAVDVVAALRLVRRREAPVAVARLGQAVVDLRAHPQRVIHAPAPGPPALLGHEQGRHQRLEHAAAPRRRHPHARVGERALEDGLAEVAARVAERLRLDEAGGECAERAVVLARRDLALLDPDVGRDPALGDGRVVAAHRLAGLGLVVEEDLVALGVVVEVEVHRVEQPLRLRAQLGHPIRDDAQPDREPRVVDRRQPRRDLVAARRHGRDVAGADVVPVEVLAAVGALHPLERAQRAAEARDGLAVADDAQPLG